MACSDPHPSESLLRASLCRALHTAAPRSSQPGVLVVPIVQTRRWGCSGGEWAWPWGLTSACGPPPAPPAGLGTCFLGTRLPHLWGLLRGGTSSS